nr:MAG TPA: hypothetical protein [Caudoviricetes sp.]
MKIYNYRKIVKQKLQMLIPSKSWQKFLAY